MRRIGVAAVALGAGVLVVPPPALAADNIAAPMSGDEEVPAVDTQATGVAKFKLRDEGLAFKVNVAKIDNVVASHIHCGSVGVNGPVGVTLFGGGPRPARTGSPAHLQVRREPNRRPSDEPPAMDRRAGIGDPRRPSLLVHD